VVVAFGRWLGSSPNSGDSTVEGQIRAVFPDSIENKAIRVARCESGLNPIAVGLNTNGTKDVGVFQFNTGGTLQEYLPGNSRRRKSTMRCIR
jgi:hypothetical protein